MTYNHFGRVLRRIRQNAGLTQSNLSEIIGCTSSHVAMLEQGNAKPSYILLVNLIEKFDLDANILFKNKGDADRQLDNLIKTITCLTPEQRQGLWVFLQAARLTLDESEDQQ